MNGASQGTMIRVDAAGDKTNIDHERKIHTTNTSHQKFHAAMLLIP